MKPRSKSAFTRVELLVVIVLIGILGALLIRPLSQASGSRYRVSCASHLKSLMAAQFNYAAQYGRPDGRLPEELGSDFWLKLQRTPQPLIDRYEVFVCPFSDDQPGPGICSYRGPAVPIRFLSDPDPMAADNEGNHGTGAGGTVMTKLGDCFEAEADHPIWLRARATTKE